MSEVPLYPAVAQPGAGMSGPVHTTGVCRNMQAAVCRPVQARRGPCSRQRARAVAGMRLGAERSITCMSHSLLAVTCARQVSSVVGGGPELDPESGPFRAVHLSLHTWPGGSVN